MTGTTDGLEERLGALLGDRAARGPDPIPDFRAVTRRAAVRRTRQLAASATVVVVAVVGVGLALTGPGAERGGRPVAVRPDRPDAPARPLLEDCEPVRAAEQTVSPTQSGTRVYAEVVGGSPRIVVAAPTGESGVTGDGRAGARSATTIGGRDVTAPDAQSRPGSLLVWTELANGQVRALTTWGMDAASALRFASELAEDGRPVAGLEPLGVPTAVEVAQSNCGNGRSVAVYRGERAARYAMVVELVPDGVWDQGEATVAVFGSGTGGDRRPAVREATVAEWQQLLESTQR